MPKGILLRFWGVRGSIPCPGPSTVKYGGNTTCLELRFGEREQLIIIDAGSGIRPLGDYLMKNDFPKGPIQTDILISHTHWDHIMGFPFFTPIYIKSSNINVYGPVTYEEDTLDKIIGDQLRYRYFPVRQEELAATIRYHQLRETSFLLGEGVFVTTKYLNHPILCLGYRFEYKGKVLCTAYDTEPFRNVFPTDPSHPEYDPVAAEEGELAAQEETEKFLRFIQGADLLIHDTQYTLEEYKASKIGWGHSTFEHAINSAHKAGVKKLILFHHDPLRTDEQLDALVEKYRSAIRGRTRLQIEVAREGLALEL
jgi:phosphoribosyl 1,2-cyclic phosphodiesterase